MEEKTWWMDRRYRFIQTPWTLFEDKRYEILSFESKLLYGVLFERMRLSAENGWTDEDDEVYIFFTIEEIKKMTGYGYDRVNRMLHELQGAALLFRKKQGLGKPDKLYVKPFSTECDYVVSDNPNSVDGISKTQELGQAERNNSEVNKSEFNNEIDRYDMLLSQIKNSIEYDILIENEDKANVDEIVLLIADVMSDKTPVVRFGEHEYLREQVIERFRMLNYDHIEYVLQQMKRCKPSVGNIRAYLLTALYNAPATMDSYYTADARAWA